MGDHRARRRDRAVADFDRRHQSGVGADERARADIGFGLGEAVIIAGDGARADIGALSHPGVAQIGEMIGLGAFFNHRILHFHEVADMRARADLGARPQTGKRTDDRAAGNRGAFQMGMAAQPRAGADRHAGAEHHKGFDLHVILHHRVVSEKHVCGADMVTPSWQPCAGAVLNLSSAYASSAAMDPQDRNFIGQAMAQARRRRASLGTSVR